MEFDRRDGNVRIWWGERFEYDEEDETSYEVAPDVLMSEERANWLVVEMLRGPMGPAGPMGAMGIAGKADEHIHQLPIGGSGSSYTKKNESIQ